jgi:hypothetical protein
MKLFVGIDRNDEIGNPEKKRSRDDCPCLVGPFLKKFFEYSEKFVCITVCEDNENIVDGPSGREAKTANLANAYGFQFELKSDLIDDIRLVCSGDVQNVICGAYKALLNEEGITEFSKRFALIPREATRQVREEILMQAMASKNPYPYVEARIYRSLRRDDFVNPEAGEKEFLAGLILNGRDINGHDETDETIEGRLPENDDDFFS